jgi:hypothetical protein
MQSWLAEVDPARFDEFIRVFWRYLRQISDDLPEQPLEGIGDLPARPGCLSYAFDKATRFAAFRGFIDAGDTEAPRLEQFDVFFISPQSTKPRIGLRLQPLHRAAPNSLPPKWWTDELQLPGAAHTGRPLPGFLELVSILASRGDVVTTSAEVQAVLTDTARELEYYRQLSASLSEDLRLANAKVRDLIARPQATASDTLTDIEDVPEPAVTDLSGLPEWAAQNSHRITVMPRALGAAKKAVYENPATVYAALELLAGAYRDSRMGTINREAFEDALKSTGLQLRGSAGQTGLGGNTGEDYHISWNGRRRVMDMHLAKGSGRDPRFCLRVYFFWDDDTQKAIVGWLPSHLDNSLT